MGNTGSSAQQPPNWGAKLVPSNRHSRSWGPDESSAYLVAGPCNQELEVPDVYSLDTSTDSAMCCGPTPRDGTISFVSREEALMKARYYKDRNPELAKQAYLFALNFPSTKFPGKALTEEGSQAPSSCGCSFVRCAIPHPVSSCWASSQSGPKACEGGPGEPLQKMASAEAMSTAFTSGTVSRLHTDDLDELVVHNPMARRLHGDDAGIRSSGKEDYGQLEESSYKAEIHAELAQLHLMNGEPLEALECYRCASALAPEQLAYSYRRGVVFQQIGEREKAISCFRSVLKTDPSYKPAIFNLGVCLAGDAKTRIEALETFELLLSLDPGNENALDMIADIHEQEGRFPEAYAAKQRVVNLDPTNFRAGRDLARLGSTLMKKGEVPGYVTLN